MKSEQSKWLLIYLQKNPNDIQAMLALARLSEAEMAVKILTHALKIEPENETVKQYLRAARKSLEKNQESAASEVSLTSDKSSLQLEVAAPITSLGIEELQTITDEDISLDDNDLIDLQPETEDESVPIRHSLGRAASKNILLTLGRSKPSQAFRSNVQRSWQELRRGYSSPREYLSNTIVFITILAFAFSTSLLITTALLCRETASSSISTALQPTSPPASTPFLALPEQSLPTSLPVAEEDEVVCPAFEGERIEDEPSLRNKIISEGSVEIIITLVDPAPLNAPDQLRKRAVSKCQNDLLTMLTEGFARTDTFVNLPALTGIVTEVSVIDLLKHQKNVLYVKQNKPGTLDIKEAKAAIGLPSELGADYEVTGDGITIAVLDTGVDTENRHVQNVTGEYCFDTVEIPQCSSNKDNDGHGTHIAGIIAASRDSIAPKANIISFKITRRNDPFGKDEVNPAAVLYALEYIDVHQGQLGFDRDQSVQIINMSFHITDVFPTDCDDDRSLADYQNVISRLVAKKIVVVAASGNLGSHSGITAPACLSKVISVGATYDRNVGNTSECILPLKKSAQTIWCDTNVGPTLDIFAPGSRITSTWSTYVECDSDRHPLETQDTQKMCTTEGTSEASAVAVGVIALMLEANSCLQPTQIEDFLKKTGTAVTDSSVKLINAPAAIEQAKNFDCQPPIVTSCEPLPPPVPGGYIAFTDYQEANDDDGDIWIVDEYGGNLRNLTDQIIGEGNGLWSPDGKRLAFVVATAQDDGYERDLFILDDTGCRNLTDSLDTLFLDNVVWSSDSQKLVISSQNRLRYTENYTVGIDGSVSRMSESMGHFWLSPDNNHFVVLGGYGYGSAMLTDAVFNKVRDLTTTFSFDFVAWSPDSRELLYTAGQIYTKDLITDEERQIKIIPDDFASKSDAVYAVWSPDGTMIAYEILNTTALLGDFDTDIYVINADGSNRRAIDVDGTIEVSHPVWSSDSESLIYLRGNDPYEIYMIDIKSVTKRRVIQLQSSDSRLLHTYTFPSIYILGWQPAPTD
jgi:subtilisin family serine protease